MDITKEIISVALILPLLWYFIKQNTKFTQSVLSELKNQTGTLNKLLNISVVHDEESKISFNKIVDRIQNNMLSDFQTIRILKSEMWLTSKKKLDFLQNIMLHNHIKGREDFIKDKVRIGLLGFSEEYMTNFKSYNTKVGKLDNWLEQQLTHEQFEKFIDEICSIMFRSVEGDKVQDAYMKKQEISLIMETLQNGLAQKLKKDLHNA